MLEFNIKRDSRYDLVRGFCDPNYERTGFIYHTISLFTKHFGCSQDGKKCMDSINVRKRPKKKIEMVPVFVK